MKRADGQGQLVHLGPAQLRGMDMATGVGDVEAKGSQEPVFQ